MKKKTIIILSLAIVAIAAIVAVNAGRRANKPEAVKVASVSQGDLKSYLSTNAVIESKNKKSYIGSAQLQVKKVNVKVGDSVKQGQVMLEYDLYDLTAGIDQAKLQHSNAVLQKKELESQKKKLDDTIADLDAQIKKLEASKNPADQVQLQTLKQKREAIQPISEEKIKLADNAVALAKLSLDSANARMDKARNGIVADFDGVVTAVNAAEGAALNPSQPAIVIQQLDNLKAVLSLGKYDAMKVQVGQEAILKYGEKTYKGKVSFIQPAAVKSAGMTGQETSLEAEVDIQDPSPELKVDFDVNVDILLGNVPDAVKIPVEAIKYNKTGESFVYKLNGDTADEIQVKLGLQSDMEAQVTEGLSKGDQVILNPGIDIKDGTLVKVDEGEKK